MWQPVIRATYIRKDRLLLLLTCGHETTISPVDTTVNKQRELLASSVPCALCGREETGFVDRRIQRGLLEAEHETRVMSRMSRDQLTWQGDQIVRAKPEYL